MLERLKHGHSLPGPGAGPLPLVWVPRGSNGESAPDKQLGGITTVGFVPGWTGRSTSKKAARGSC